MFHHDWSRAASAAEKPYAADDHVLAGQATRRDEAGEALAPLVGREALEEVVALVPDVWLSLGQRFRWLTAPRTTVLDRPGAQRGHRRPRRRARPTARSTGGIACALEHVA